MSGFKVDGKVILQIYQKNSNYLFGCNFGIVNEDGENICC
jgi:hypothetical protein